MVQNMESNMKKMTIVIVVILVIAVFMPTHAFAGSKDSVEVDLLDISEMPKTAVRQQDAHLQYAVYVNVDKSASGEGEMDDVRSVWLANERSGTVIKVCVTNPMAEPQWNKMSGKDAYYGTAIQLPSTEGVVSLDWEKKEIIAASYGYDDDGRYSVNKAYSLDGKFLRRVGEKERE